MIPVSSAGFGPGAGAIRFVFVGVIKGGSRLRNLAGPGLVKHAKTLRGTRLTIQLAFHMHMHLPSGYD